MSATVRSTQDYEGAETGNGRRGMGRMLCICTFKAHLATHPGLPFYYGPPTHGGRNDEIYDLGRINFHGDSRCQPGMVMTHGPIVPDLSRLALTNDLLNVGCFG